MLSSIRLTEDTTQNLLHINYAGLVGKRRKNISKRTVPTFFKRVDSNDISHLTVAAHQVNALELILIGSLYLDLIFGNTYVNQLSFNLIERYVVLIRFWLSLKEYNRTDIPSAVSLIFFCQFFTGVS